MHVSIGPGLLIATVAYTVCRHYCASVRASILLHMINNTAVMLTTYPIN